MLFTPDEDVQLQQDIEDLLCSSVGAWLHRYLVTGFRAYLHLAYADLPNWAIERRACIPEVLLTEIRDALQRVVKSEGKSSFDEAFRSTSEEEQPRGPGKPKTDIENPTVSDLLKAERTREIVLQMKASTQDSKYEQELDLEPEQVEERERHKTPNMTIEDASEQIAPRFHRAAGTIENMYNRKLTPIEKAFGVPDKDSPHPLDVPVADRKFAQWLWNALEDEAERKRNLSP